MDAMALPDLSGSAPDPALWQALGWQPQARQLQQLLALQDLLRHWNQRLNLTRLVEGDDYWIAQVFDSLWPLLPLLSTGSDAAGLAAMAPSPAPSAPATGAAGEAAACRTAERKPADGAPPAAEAARQASVLPPAGSGLRVIDVGTGGGFPGLAVAIALPGARVTLLDSVQRKLDAVAAMAAELGLADRIELRCERVERTGRDRHCRGRFQLAMARAVAAAPVVAEYLVPLLAADGQALMYRGQWSDADEQELLRALTLLRARIGSCRQRELPSGRGLRTALTLLPQAACPAAYPRAVGVPAKQPLGQPPLPVTSHSRGGAVGGQQRERQNRGS